MKYAIVYSSKTGNTKMLAEALQNMLPHEECVYFGEPNLLAQEAERLYVGFWTDKGSCDAAAEEFLKQLRNKEVFLFGTAGFGGEQAYFECILEKVSQKLDKSCTVIGTYMCQGKMPMAVRERYERMMSAPDHAPNLEKMIENFDKALSHPDENDLLRLKKASGIL